MNLCYANIPLRGPGPPLLDCEVEGNNEAPTKNWEGGFVALTYVMESVKEDSTYFNQQGLNKYGLKMIINTFVNNMAKDKSKLGELIKELSDGSMQHHPDPVFKRVINDYCLKMF